MKKRVLKVIAITALLASMLIAVTFLVLTTSPGENLVRGWLEGQISEYVGGSAEIGTLETNLFSRLQLQNVLVRLAKGTSCDTLVQIGQLRLDYALWDLVGKEIVLKALTLDTIEICLERDSTGHFGIAAIDMVPENLSPAEESNFRLKVGQVSVESANVRYYDASLLFLTRLINGRISVKSNQQNIYAFDLSIEEANAEYDDLPLPIVDIRCSGSWSGTKLAVESLSANFAELQCLAEGALSQGDSTWISGELTVSGSPSVLIETLRSRYDLPVLQVDSGLFLHATVSGPLESPEIRAELSLPRMIANEISLESCYVSGDLSVDTLTLDTLSFDCFGGLIIGKGTVMFDTTLAASLALTVSRIHIADIWTAMYHYDSPYKGILDGELSVTGKGTDPIDWRIESDFIVSAFHYQSRTIPDLEFTLSFEAGTGKLNLRQGETMLRADLRVLDTLIDGSFNLDVPEIELLTGLFNQPELTGQVSAAGTLSGHLENPTLSSAITCRQIHYNGFPIDSIYAQLRYKDSALFVDTGYAFGILKVADSSQAPFGLESISATFSYDVSLSGRLDSLRGQVSAEARSLRYQGYSVDSAAVSASIDGHLVQLTDLNIYYGHLRLSSDGEFDLTANEGEIKANLWEQAENGIDSGYDSITVGSRWISAGQVSALFQLLPDRQVAIDASGIGLRISSLLRSMLDTLRIDGELGFDLAFTGNLINPFGELSAVVRSIELPEASLDSLSVSVSLLADMLRVNDVELYAYHQKLVAQAVLWLERDQDSSLMFSDESRFEGSVNINNFDLAVFSPFLTPGGELSGMGSAKLNWDGKLSYPSAQGYFNIFDARYQADSASVPINGIDVRLTLRDSLISIDTAMAVIEDFPIYLNGYAIVNRENHLTIDLSATLADIGSIVANGTISSDSINLKAGSDGFRLGVLRPFLKDADSLDGTLTCDLRISGSTDNPEVVGRVNIDDLGLISQEYYTTLRNGCGRARFDAYQIVLDSLTGNVNGGTVLLAGNVTLDQKQITDINIHLYTSRLLFSDPKIFLLQIDTSHIAYGRRAGNYVISGDIHLGESRLTVRFRPQAILPWAQSVETVEWELPTMLEQTKLDVRIRESDQLWIDNNLARIRMHAELGVIGSPIRPNLSGMVSIEEGYLLYLDRRFKVSQGSVYFSDPVRFNPDILLRAATQVTSYQRLAATKYVITIQAEGPLDQLKVDIVSEPPLDKPDIVALLTLGATRTQLGGKDTEGKKGGVKEVLLDRAAMLSSQRVSGYVSSKVGTFFGFDEFTVEGNLFQFDDSWGPQLVASRRLSERVELTYTTTVGRLNDQGVRLGYRLTPRLSLQGQTDRYGRSLLDLKYGFRFR